MWKDIINRFELTNGDLCVVRVDYQYAHACYKLAIFRGGSFWDAIVLDDPDLWNEEWTLLDGVGYEYLFTGRNYYKERKNIN